MERHLVGEPHEDAVLRRHDEQPHHQLPVGGSHLDRVGFGERRGGHGQPH